MSSPIIGVNKAILVGTVSDAPEVRSTQTGREVVNFGVMTQKVATWTEERKPLTTYHKVVAWGHQVADARNLRQGDVVTVEGEIVVRRWESPDGQKRKSYEINATLIQKIGGDDNQTEMSFGEETPDDLFD